jgi:hypothetical protein
MADALSSTYDTTYLQVPMASYIATVDSFPQQTRGAANALPHYPRTLKNAFSFFFGFKMDYWKNTKPLYSYGGARRHLWNRWYEFQPAVAEVVVAVKEPLQ